MDDRSTPGKYKDFDRVTDAKGRIWSYSEPNDVWRLLNQRLDAVIHTSSRSFHRLRAEFGPLVKR